MQPQTICEKFWQNVITKIQIERDPISSENYRDYETLINQPLVIGDHRFGAVYAVDNLYCAYKSVIQLLNKKDPKIHDFKTGLYSMHNEEGLISMSNFQNFRDSYGIKESIPILTKKQFDEGFNNHKKFTRDCIIMISGSAVDESYMHMLAYKAAGKPYVKLMEMECQTVEENIIEAHAVNTNACVKTEKPKQYTRKAKDQIFSGTRKDFFHMLRLAYKLYSERFQNGLLTESFESSSIFILGQLSLHKSYIYQYIDFTNDFSQIVFSAICVILNRKSELVLQMPPKTINLPTRYVSNVTPGEKTKNSKISLQNLMVGVWTTKKQKQLVKQKNKERILQDNKEKKQQKLLLKKQVDQQVAELRMIKDIAKQNMKMIHDKVIDDCMQQDDSQLIDLCLSYDYIQQQDQNIDLSFNIYTNNTSLVSDELQNFEEPMNPFDKRTQLLLTEQQAMLKQQVDSGDILLLASQLPQDLDTIYKMDQDYISTQPQDKYSNRWNKFTKNIVTLSSSQLDEDQLLPVSDDEDTKQQNNTSQQNQNIDIYEDSNTKATLIGALSICETNKSLLLKSSSLLNLWFLTVIVTNFVSYFDAYFTLIEIIIQILMKILLSTIEITYKFCKLVYCQCKYYFISQWDQLMRTLRDSTLHIPVVDISQPALLGIQPASLAQIYSHYVIPVQLLNKDKIRHWQYVDGYGITANPQPGVTKQCLQAISKAGLYVHAKSLNNSTTTGGGHSCIRFCSDSMFSKTLQYISKAHEPMVIVDVGAKYRSMLSILNQIYINKDIQPNHFCAYLPVRPNELDYDQAYHEQNFSSYNNFVWGKQTRQKDGKNTVYQLPVQQKYIQDVDWELVQIQVQKLFGFIENVKYYVIMNDCHYYFDNTFSLPFKHTLLLSGMNYTPYTGKYLLPFSDGYFQIDANQETKRGQITMMPQSTTKKYTHPYTFIDQTDCEIDFGWISFIQKVQVMQPDQRYDIYTPNVIDVGCNVQQHYFHQYYSTLPSNYDTIKQQQARWEKQQFQKTVEVQYNSQEALLYQNNDKTIFQKIILYIYHSWIMRFIFGEIKYVYDQSAYIHLPKAGQTKTPTRTNPQAVIHDQVPYDKRSKKTMIGGINKDVTDQIMLGYISPQTFRDFNNAFGLQPQDLDYNTLPHTSKPKEIKYRKINANQQQNNSTCYVTKDFPDTVILNASQINPLIKVAGQDDQYNYNYQQCIKQYHNAEIIKQTTLVLPTGIRHLRMTQEEQLATVEFASTSIHNQIFALYGRCFKSQQQFSQIHLQSYKNMVQRFLAWFEKQLNDQLTDHFDPIQWIDQKEDFPFEKKQKYQRTILQQLKGNMTDFQFSYKSMLKSGEEFLIPIEDLDLPKVVVDKKPRDIKVPAPQGCGIFTAIQSEFWEPIKRILPGFIQGYLPQDLKDLFKDNIDKYDSVISDDGSSFEATQFYDLQQIVDKPIMLILLKWFKLNNIDNAMFQNLWINMPLSKLVDLLCPDKNLVFVKMPNDGEVWDDITIRWWNRDWKQAHGPAEDNYDKYLPYWIRGTTFSGVPQTTLMNTFRKLTYSYYDIYVATGIDAWVSDDFFVAAAGDDGITMGNNQNDQLTRIQQVKLNLSNPDTKIRGLGQCITEAPITESWNFDFCSKLVLRDHGVFMGRDLLKTLTQKQYFTKKNQVFQVYPHLHVQAILDGLIAEKSSKLLEDIIRVRLDKVTIDEQTDYQLPPKKSYHSLTTDTGYVFEDIINQFLNIDLSDLIMHIESGQAIDPRPLKTHSEHDHQDKKLGYIEQYKTTTKNNFNSKMNQQQKKKPIKQILSNRKKKQQTRDKNVNKRPNTVSQVNMKQSQNQKRTQFHVVKSKNNFQQLQVKHKPTMDYIKSILNPFNTDAVRAPSDFHLPTSILNHRFEIDHMFGTTHGVACLLPQHMSGQGGTNTPSWFNVQGIHSTQTTSATLGGAGILTGECPLAGYHTTDPSSGGQTAENKRFTSARLLRVGIKIYPTANLTVKSGTVVIAQVPGKTFYSNVASIKVPTVQQLKQYPTSITVNLSTIDQSGQSYVWLPLDVDDTIFQSPSLGIAGQDNQASMQQFRNPIWACFEGISAQDSYRFEIYSSYEYVPTMLFESWANVSVTKTPSGAYNALKKILDNDLFKAVAGVVGEELTQSKYATGMLKPAFDTFMSLV